MINIIFTLLNTVIFLGIFAYAAIRSLPTLRKRIEQEQALETDLHDEHHQLILMQRHTDESAILQDEECARLLVKINQWKVAVDSAARGKEALVAQEQQELARKIAQQSEYYSLHTMYQKISPLVVADLEAALRIHFSDEKQAHAYVDRFIEGLRK